MHSVGSQIAGPDLEQVCQNNKKLPVHLDQGTKSIQVMMFAQRVSAKEVFLRKHNFHVLLRTSAPALVKVARAF